jgi:hypothetical protein
MATVENIHDPEKPGLPTPGESPELARGLSLLEQARKRREERESHLFVDVPSWEGELVAEYRILNPDELDAIADNAARKIKSGERDSVFADLDLIAKANVALYMRDPDSGDRVPLEDELGKIGFGRAAQVLGLQEELNTVVKTIKYMMGERRDDGSGWQVNPTAITMHANRIARWMRDPSKGGMSLEEILGES